MARPLYIRIYDLINLKLKHALSLELMFCSIKGKMNPSPKYLLLNFQKKGEKFSEL